MAQAQATKTPIDQGIIDRVVRGIKYVVNGGNADAWFGPQQPLVPFAQDEAKGRQFDYAVGFNVNIQPRHSEPISFAQLRALADNLDLLRLVIETRKDLMCKLQFEIRPIDPKKESDARCEMVQDFFRFPDGEHTWDEWLRMILEDLFVLDAPTVYPRMTLGGSLYSLEPIDGSTITRKIDSTGRTPLPPEVAYQQIIKGVPAVDYSRDELIYKPRNLRTNKVYGFSPVEQIIMTVNIALRRQVSQLQYYTEGDAVDRIMSVPSEWNPDQVKQFKAWWEEMLAGNTGARRGTMFVPDGVKSVNTKEAMLKDGYDEWLARIICFAFSIAPQNLIAQVNRATAETAAETAKAEGLEPIMMWVKNLIDYIVWKYFGFSDLHLSWKDEKDPDLKMQAEIHKIYVDAGVLLVNEVREEIGREALTPEQEAQIAAKKVQAAQQAMGGKKGGEDDGGGGNAPPDDDATKMEGHDLKKAARGLPPLNRQRKEVVALRDRLATRIEAFFKRVRASVATDIVAAYSAVNKVEGQDDSVAQIIGTASIPWEDFMASVDPVLRDLAAAGVAAAAAQLDIRNVTALDLANEGGIRYARQRAAEMVGKRWEGEFLVDNPNAKWRIDESTRAMLRTQVTNAMEEGWSNDKLANAIEESAAFSQERSVLIARTETAMADIEGNMELWKQAEGQGLKLYKKWITANDDKVSPDCAECGKVDWLPLTAEYPNGRVKPPDHPNCRCDLKVANFVDLIAQRGGA